jgi:hypothetical protein
MRLYMRKTALKHSIAISSIFFLPNLSDILPRDGDIKAPAVAPVMKTSPMVVFDAPRSWIYKDKIEYIMPEQIIRGKIARQIR